MVESGYITWPGGEQVRAGMRYRIAGGPHAGGIAEATGETTPGGLVRVRWPDDSVTGMRPAFFLRAVQEQPAPWAVFCSRCGEELEPELLARLADDTDFHEHGDRGHLAAFEPTPANFAAARAAQADRDARELARRLEKMTPMERTLAANDPANGSTAVRVIALTMLDD